MTENLLQFKSDHCHCNCNCIIQQLLDFCLSEGIQLDLNVGETPHVSQFSSVGNKEGGARLQHLPISFAHATRKERKDRTSDDVKEKVDVYYKAKCATSPCAKHQVRKRIGPLCYIVVPLLILMSSIGSLYKSFIEVLYYLLYCYILYYYLLILMLTCCLLLSCSFEFHCFLACDSVCAGISFHFDWGTTFQVTTSMEREAR